MRIYELAQAIIDKFVPMNDTTKTELHLGAQNSYQQIKAEAFTIKQKIVEANEWNTRNKEAISEGKEEKMIAPNLKLKHKAIELLEAWWMRYILAIAFIFLVPKVKAIINGESSNKEEMPDDGEVSFEDFREFMRFKKSM